MAQPENERDGPRWHEALAYAITGRHLVGLGRQSSPSVGALAHRLQHEVGAQTLAADIGHRLDNGQPWPYPVPPDLMVGLGFAQFSAALRLLRSELGLDQASSPKPRVGTGQAITAADRRLLDEVPPHHGSK